MYGIPGTLNTANTQQTDKDRGEHTELNTQGNLTNTGETHKGDHKERKEQMQVAHLK